MIVNHISEIMGRKRLKISQLAELANINKNTALSLYHARNTRIDFEVLDKLCVALDCEVGDIFEHVKDNG